MDLLMLKVADACCLGIGVHVMYAPIHFFMLLVDFGYSSVTA